MRIQDLGANHIAVEIRFWTDSRRSDYVATASLVRSAIVDALRAAGVSLPDPGVLTIVRASAPTLNQRQQVLNTVDPVNDP